jgi:hypothetical protein
VLVFYSLPALDGAGVSNRFAEPLVHYSEKFLAVPAYSSRTQN